MNKISVIGTIHAEGGACTSDELIKIIQRISPKVIFCEASPEDFPAMVKATERFNPPEFKALRMLIQNTSIEIVPVDLHGAPFDGRLEAMLELFKTRMKEYYYASEIQFGETLRLGFPFLNSEDSDKIHKDKAAMERIFVARAKHDLLSQTYTDWLQWNDKRENHWINLIHEYFNKNKFDIAAFLVGSAHRIRLMEKIEYLQTTNDLIPNWDFYPFEH
jgi:hypothetical protein